MKYIKGLDSLRAFAVTVVLLGHWGFSEHLGTMGGRIFTGLVPSPKFGVDLFFVLSGFLITSILLNAKEGGEKKVSILGKFHSEEDVENFSHLLSRDIGAHIAGKALCQGTSGLVPYLLRQYSFIQGSGLE